MNLQLTSTFSWNAVSGATGYQLDVSKVQTFSPLTLSDSALTTNSKAVGPLSLNTTYFWRVRAKNDGGWGDYSLTRAFSTIRTTSVEQIGSGIPTEYGLSQNYPNPFNPTTTIQFDLPKSGFVSLKVFDLLGRQAATLISEELDAGYYRSVWRANVPSGVYFYRIQAGEFSQTKRLILLK
ncbi:MAG: T9SS type A sorting domain-containing protein [Ignavibacteriales bacterium]|nr:T9SS type A sorting domain-containing protein [Ignavibacteriales bacterium]